MATSNSAGQHDHKSDNHRSGAPETRGAASGKGSESVLAWAGKVVATHFQALKNDREVHAVAREALKDVRSTVHNVFFGQHERGGEPGAPFNPLAIEIANTGALYGVPQQDGQALPSLAEIAGGVHGPQPSQDHGQEFQIAGKSWLMEILKRGKNETPYNRDRQHIKPEDEKEQRKAQEREPGAGNDRGGGGRGR